jgi:hypothetical protein
MSITYNALVTIYIPTPMQFDSSVLVENDKHAVVLPPSLRDDEELFILVPEYTVQPLSSVRQSEHISRFESIPNSL